MRILYITKTLKHIVNHCFCKKCTKSSCALYSIVVSLFKIILYLRTVRTHTSAMIILTTSITIDVLLVFVLAEYRIKIRFIVDDITRWRILHMEDPGGEGGGGVGNTGQVLIQMYVCIASLAN